MQTAQPNRQHGFPFRELALTAVAGIGVGFVVGAGLFYLLTAVVDTGSGLSAVGVAMGLGVVALTVGLTVYIVMAGLIARHWGIDNPWSVVFVGLVFGWLIQVVVSQLVPVGISTVALSVGASGALGIVLSVTVVGTILGFYLAYYLINGNSYEVDSTVSKSRARLWLTITIVMLILSPYLLGVLVG